jgi:P27 family predicted phage terminase small subunit
MSTGRPAGRPAKPVERHRTAGNPSKKRLPMAPLPGGGLDSPGTIPAPPSTLQIAGLAVWERLWVAGRSWLSPDADYLLVAKVCAHEDAIAYRENLLRGDVTPWYEMPNGVLANHPAFTQANTLHTQQTAWLASLGFSPSDRARLGLAQVRVRDELDELYRRREQRRGQVSGS